MRRTHDATELRNEVLFILLEEFWKDFIVEVTNLKQWLKGEPCSLTRVQQVRMSRALYADAVPYG